MAAFGASTGAAAPTCATSTAAATAGGAEEWRGVAAVGGPWLVLSVSASWVCLAQLARVAEKRTEELQHSSAVPLMTVANTSAWMALCVPYALRRRRELFGASASASCASSGGTNAGSAAAAAGAGIGTWRLPELVRTDAFGSWQPARFLAIAVTTNFCYISALHFMPASLNTAIFCTSPIFTLLLSAIFLPKDLLAAPSEPGDHDLACGLGDRSRRLQRRRALSVVLSVVGVLLIAEPWHAASAHGAGESALGERLTGALLSLFASVGTAVYQVYFKLTFGSRLRPDEVGLFLANMGAICCSVLGGALAVLLATGLYPLRLSLVPWGHVGATAASSTVFNFLMKFGLSVDSPLAMSLATQIGIPLNLLLDVAVAHERIDLAQALGTIVMLFSFTLQQQQQHRPAPALPDAGPPDRGGLQEQLLSRQSGPDDH
mmetsp:Transcript_129031/g.413398  ORF Transcript_129031/g.413398 Transcript_129031/m.413398 type:complete len:433 (-) Transcript_129031:199-1497(-)